MPDLSTMTLQQARKVLWIAIATLAVSLLGFVALVIYGLAHPVKHRALLVILATVICPLVFAFLLRKAGIGGLFEQGSAFPPTSMKAALRRNPTFLILVPMIITGILWGFLLIAIGMRKGGDPREWMKNHMVLVLLWIMMPQILAAYLSIVLHATYTGMYIAGCIVYATAKVAVGGLKLENGAVAFFGTHKSHASPLVILTLALMCVASFGLLHFAVWSTWPSEYLNMHGIEDAMYFSVVTMATVGYGDILPVGHAARWLCVAEILSGILLLVVGVSASMTIWLQVNQPISENSRNISKDTLAVGANGDPKPPEPGAASR